MRVARTELIATLKARRDGLIKAAEDRYKDERAKEQERERAYFESTCQDWAKLAEVILDKHVRGEVMFASDISDSLRQDGYLGFRPRTVKLQHPQVGALSRLITLLEASPDETVSVPSLERAGFSLGTLLK